LVTLGVPDFLSVLAALLVRTRVPKRAFFYWITSFSKVFISFSFLGTNGTNPLHKEENQLTCSDKYKLIE
jgi:hypothetical protein